MILVPVIVERNIKNVAALYSSIFTHLRTHDIWVKLLKPLAGFDAMMVCSFC